MEYGVGWRKRGEENKWTSGRRADKGKGERNGMNDEGVWAWHEKGEGGEGKGNFEGEVVWTGRGKNFARGYTRKRGDCSEEEMCFFNCNNRVEPEGTRGGQDTRKQHIQGGVLASHASFVGMKSGMVIALEEKKLFILSASFPFPILFRLG